MAAVNKGWTPVAKYRWDLPEDASEEEVEHDRKRMTVLTAGWQSAGDGPRWAHLSRPGETFTLDAAYLIVRAAGSGG